MSVRRISALADARLLASSVPAPGEPTFYSSDRPYLLRYFRVAVLERVREGFSSSLSLSSLFFGCLSRPGKPSQYDRRCFPIQANVRSTTHLLGSGPRKPIFSSLMRS